MNDERCTLSLSVGCQTVNWIPVWPQPPPHLLPSYARSLFGLNAHSHPAELRQLSRREISHFGCCANIIIRADWQTDSWQSHERTFGKLNELFAEGERER